MTMLTIATWNVNSLRVRLAHLLDWLRTETAPQIIALQETKVLNDHFPLEAITALGYHAAFSGQKAYNGVAILSRIPPTAVVNAIPGWDDSAQRVLAATIDSVRIVNVYVPNGEHLDSEKYHYKLAWLNALLAWLKSELASEHGKNMLVLGDFNIAPAAMDVYDPLLWKNCVLCSDQERDAFQRLLQLGLQDCLAQFCENVPSFTWWDYRCNAFKRNHGLRIDHILASSSLATRCQHCFVVKQMRALDRPSDHAPVMAEFRDD